MKCNDCVIRHPSYQEYEIEYCPLHAAAPSMKNELMLELAFLVEVRKCFQSAHRRNQVTTRMAAIERVLDGT